MPHISKRSVEARLGPAWDNHQTRTAPMQRSSAAGKRFAQHAALPTLSPTRLPYYSAKSPMAMVSPHQVMPSKKVCRQGVPT